MEHTEALELPPEVLRVLTEVLTAEGLELKSHVVHKGCQPGDNYLGEVLRVITTTSRPHSQHQLIERRFIFKCPPFSEKWREGLKTIKYTRNETSFYMKVHPELESFKKERAGNALPPLSVPKFYASQCDTANDVLILEDMKPAGYVMADRMKGMDFNHCRIVMEELGRLHAISIAMKTIEPSKFDKLKQVPKEVYYFEEGRAQFATVDQPCNAAFRMLKIRFPDSNYAEKLEKLTTNFFTNMMELVSTETDLSVINHGDCWTNNMLFKYYTDGTPEKVVLLDFQGVRYSSVALDLSYFIYICITKEIRDKYWEEILTVYLAELNDALAKMRVPTAQVSRAQLDAELIRFARFGIGMSLMTIPLFTTPVDQQPSLDGGLEVFDKFHKTTHTNKLCVERVTDGIEDAVKRGYL